MNLSPSNRFRVLTGLARRHTARSAMVVVASALASPAFANTITFETAPVGSFSGPVTENGFTYSNMSGALLVNPLFVGNPGKDVEGTISGGGVLKIVSATGSDFNFDDLDFSAYDVSGTGSHTLKLKGFSADCLSGLIDIHSPTLKSLIRSTIIGPRKLHLYWLVRAFLSLISL